MKLVLVMQFITLLVLPISIKQATTLAACPMNLNYVEEVPWNSSTCHGSSPVNPTDISANSTSPCCQTLLSLYGIGLSQHLKDTSQFHLSDLNTSISCLQDFQSKITSLSLPKDIVSSCFDPTQFVISADTCAGIQTIQDWHDKLNDTSQFDSACRLDLVQMAYCDQCVEAGLKVQTRLLSSDGNNSHAANCLYFTILYAAGIANSLGPESDGAMTCILELSLDSPVKTSGNHRRLILGLSSAGVAVLVILCLVGLYLRHAILLKRKGAQGSDAEESMSRRRPRPNTGSIWYKISELEKATDNFSDENYVGKGGSGVVYKGVLQDGTLVAVKKLIESDIQGDAEFCNEVEIISNLRHRNLVSLKGCCVIDGAESNDERYGQRYLVYDYMPNGNLADHLFTSLHDPNIKIALSWQQRQSMILDVAEGLAYLHYGVKPAIYHRDIKATNILLDANMRARVADFGLAKQNRDEQSHLTTRVAGTHGYLAPEYALYGQLSAKSDVYSFGVVILEIMCGRKALDTSSSESPQANLITDWAWSLVKAGNAMNALDAFLVEATDPLNGITKATMERYLLVGILCAHIAIAARPNILDAIKMLEGHIEVPSIPERPAPVEYPEFVKVGLFQH